MVHGCHVHAVIYINFLTATAAIGIAQYWRWASSSPVVDLQREFLVDGLLSLDGVSPPTRAPTISGHLGYSESGDKQLMQRSWLLFTYTLIAIATPTIYIYFLLLAHASRMRNTVHRFEYSYHGTVNLNCYNTVLLVSSCQLGCFVVCGMQRFWTKISEPVKLSFFCDY
jgi:hypothetical protein